MLRRPALRRLALFLLLALVPAAQAGQAPTTWAVTDFGDRPAGAPSRDPGPAGSLRYILMKQAKAGDTIVFKRAAVVSLTSPLEVIADLTGLRISGKVGDARAGLRDQSAVARWRTSTGAGFGLIVRADRVTVEDVVFTDTPLVFAGSAGVRHLRGGAARRNLFNGRHGYVALVAVSDPVVNDNEFVGSQDAAFEAVDTTRLRFTGNEVATTRRAGVDTTTSDDVRIEGNTFQNAAIRLELTSGFVRDNELAGSSTLNAGDWGVKRQGLNVVENTLALSPAGRVRMLLSNTLSFSRNRVSGGQAVIVDCATQGLGAGKRRLTMDSNTISGSATGVTVACPAPEAARVSRNRITGSRGNGVQVRQGRGVLLDRNRVEASRATGILFLDGTDGVVKGGTVRRNGRSGVYAAGGGGATRVTRTAFGGNGGAGISAERGGRYPPAASSVKYDEGKGKLTGGACKGCTVEVFEAEAGDEPGEGTRFLGSVTSTGSFTFPKRGELDCPDSGRVTVTVTKPGGGTSRFSADVECSCVASVDFALDPKQVPPTGFFNFGVTYGFRNGTSVGRATLTEKRSEKRPSPGALDPQLQWQEFLNEPGPPASFLGPGYFTRDFFVNVSYRPGAAGTATGARTVWHYTIPYDPPRGAAGCGGKFVAASLPAG